MFWEEDSNITQINKERQGEFAYIILGQRGKDRIAVPKMSRPNKLKWDLCKNLLIFPPKPLSLQKNAVKNPNRKITYLEREETFRYCILHTLEEIKESVK